MEQLCDEALAYGFGAVCVAPIWVAHVSAYLQARTAASTSAPKVACVVGFPHGTSTPSVKALEARLAVLAGAREIDMVLDIAALRRCGDDGALEDVSAVVAAVRAASSELSPPLLVPVLVKVIFETALLTDDDKRRACRLAERAGAHFVKTSTGFAAAGATVADVALMRDHVGAHVGVKASGGIRSLDDALAMLRAGASRLGCSAGVQIVQQWRQRHSAQPASAAAESATQSGDY